MWDSNSYIEIKRESQQQQKMNLISSHMSSHTVIINEKLNTQYSEASTTIIKLSNYN
jgi:hypothetical protein